MKREFIRQYWPFSGLGCTVNGGSAMDVVRVYLLVTKLQRNLSVHIVGGITGCGGNEIMVVQ